MNVNINYNTEKNGVELSFEGKPAAEVLTSIKAAGFRWHRQKKIWYAKQNDQTITFATSLAGSDVVAAPTVVFETAKDRTRTANQGINLWAATRTDGIGDNFQKFHIYDTKEIAAIIRRELRSRFPFCKWSVRKDGYNAIDVYLVSSPFAKDSEEVKAIVAYADAFTDSYNYNNSDIMTDYFDVNFYGTVAAAYDYIQRDATVSEVNMAEEFQKAKVAFEKAEQERMEREFQERIEQEKIEAVRREEARKVQEENRAKIEAAARVEDVDFTVYNTMEAHLNKNCTLAEYESECAKGEFQRTDCEVVRAVHLNEESYNLFINMLINPWSFLTGMGGCKTYDPRIGSSIDYDMMTAAERETIKFVSGKCVAIYKNDELMFVVDAQGHDYARYCMLLDSESYVGGNPKEDEENRLAEYKPTMEMLLDVSTSIITENDMGDTWQRGHENNEKYIRLMLDWIREHNVDFNVNVIRALDEDYENVKITWYQILEMRKDPAYQFETANIEYNQKITVVRLGSLGGLHGMKAHYKGYEKGSYAQYRNAVKLFVRPERKRSDYYFWLHENSDVIIFDGWLDVPENLLFDVIDDNPVFRTKMSKFRSFDDGQYDVVLEYFAAQGIYPILNTYNGVCGDTHKE